MYVLQNTETGKYVARSGSPHSYTRRLEDAQTFRTAEEAKAASCPENERAIPLDRLMQKPL